MAAPCSADDGSYHDKSDGAFFVHICRNAAPVTSREEIQLMSLLLDILLVLIGGLALGEIADRLGLPRLIGMIAGGMLLGPHLLDWLSPTVYEISPEIRMLALLVILLKAGLGLDKNKILAQGSVALRLGFMPAVIEAGVVTLAARWLFAWPWLYCWLLGWIVCAASPAVIVPMMLYLKSRGWGVDKGIPDLILAGGTMSDATAITMFGIFVTWLADGISGGWIQQVVQIPLQIIAGAAIGYAAGKLAHYILRRTPFASSPIQDVLVGGTLALLLILGGGILPYSDFLAVMVMGFVILETDPVLARRLRTEIDRAWAVAQIFLFVLIGAAVNLDTIATAGLRGIAVVAIGLAVGRWLGIFASTWGSNINLVERMFMVVGDMAKATVQAAIGGIPLAMGLAYGEEILAISVISIVITAPLGAFGTVALAPRMLKRGDVDPSRVTVHTDHRFLVALDGSRVAACALDRAAAIAREADADLLILHVTDEPQNRDRGMEAALQSIDDIEHEFSARPGSPPETIIETARASGCDYIFMGKSNSGGVDQFPVGSVARQVIESTDIPVILVDPNEEERARETAADTA